MDLPHRAAGRERHQLGQPQDLLGAADVGVGVPAEQPRERQVVVDDLLDAALLLGLADEVLLAGGADDVGVGVAVAHVVERVAAAQPLVAGLDVDRGVGDVGVEVAAVDVRVHAAHLVDRGLEALEVDVDHVVDADPREIGLHRPHRQPGSAVRVGGVDLRRAVAGDQDLEVAGDGEQRRGVLGGVQVDEHHRVRVPLDPPQPVGLAHVGAEDEDRLRGARLGRGELGHLQRLLVPVLADRRGHVAHLQQAGGGGGDRAQHDHQAGGQREALPHVQGQARRPLRVVHRSPPMARIPL